MPVYPGAPQLAAAPDARCANAGERQESLIWIDGTIVDMKNQYTAVVRRDGAWWIGWVEEIPGVNSQGETREELMSSCSLHWSTCKAVAARSSARARITPGGAMLRTVADPPCLDTAN